MNMSRLGPHRANAFRRYSDFHRRTSCEHRGFLANFGDTDQAHHKRCQESGGIRGSDQECSRGAQHSLGCLCGRMACQRHRHRVNVFFLDSLWNRRISDLSGIVGLAISLALQNTLTNIISGILILSDGVLRLHDSVEYSGVRGRVVKIGLRATWVKTDSGDIAIISNNYLANGPLVNFTARERLERKLRL